jgi:putative membrane protein
MMEPVENKNQSTEVNQPKTPAEYVRLFFTGVAMGSADIVPGVSGGTMAFILGVYQDLINSIKSFNLDLIRLVLKGDIRGAINHIPWRFLIALLGGIGAAIVTLVTGLEFALHNYPIYLFSFFTGLIVASIIAVGANVKWNVGSGIALVVAAVAAFFIVGLRPQDMAHTPLLLFISGAIAICAMILPGVSGSFLLLVLGQYEHVIGSVRGLISFENVGANLVTVASVGLGCVVGIVIFSRFLSWLLRKYENNTVAALVGFMVGSLRIIYPFKGPVLDAAGAVETYVDTDGITVAYTQNVLPWVAQHVENLEEMVRLTGTEITVSLLLLAFGFLLVSFLDHLQSRNNPVFRPFLGGKRNAVEAEVAASGD